MQQHWEVRQVFRSGVLRSICVVGLVSSVLGAAACGSDDNSSSSAGGGGSSTTSTQAAGKKIKVGVVTDIGGLNDRGFNQLANDGLQRAIKELGVQGRVISSSKNSDYIPNLGTFGQQGYDLIIGNGFLMGDAVAASAKKFPKSKFAIIDFSQSAMKGKPTNAQGLVFKEQEGGYLVGYAAGLYAKDNNAKAVSVVGGQKVPAVDHYIAGYEAGAKAANPDVKVLSGYSGDFVDQAKCKELALNQIEQGSKVVFAAAGQCGLGALDAAKQSKAQGIGVDNDQSFLGPHIMTSATKKVDVAVFDAIKAAQDGTFKGGTDQVFDVKNGGMGVGKFNEVGQKYASKVEDIQKKIASGEITPPQEPQSN
jgi:basic membrane protein A and related proteins